MARASVKTLLPLDSFARVAGVHPLHFNQVSLSDLPTQGDDSTARTCDVPIFQYQWQTANRMGREDIAEAIAQAEDLLIPHLGFKPVPDWTRDDRVSAARPSNPVLYSGNSRDVRGLYNTVKANEGYLISGGQEAKSVITANTPITYSDLDNDGYFETATVTVATSVTSPDEIAVYYPGKSAASDWEIRPLKSVTISGGNAVIVFTRQQVVKEELLETMFPVGLDGTNDANFLEEVDVYRHYNDPSMQVQLIYDGAYCGNCNGDGCQSCGFGLQTGCLVVRDHKLGVVSYQPGTWDADTQEFTYAQWGAYRAPERLNLFYYAGWENTRAARPRNTMDPRWERVISLLAMQFMDRPLCQCPTIDANIQHWREDVAHNISTRGESSSFRIPTKQFENPFGTSRGALFAWKAIQDYRIGEVADNA